MVMAQIRRRTRHISSRINSAVDEVRRVFRYLCDCFEEDAPRLLWLVLGMKGAYDIIRIILGW
jgi:hypothetical protein